MADVGEGVIGALAVAQQMLATTGMVAGATGS